MSKDSTASLRSWRRESVVAECPPVDAYRDVGVVSEARVRRRITLAKTEHPYVGPGWGHIAWRDQMDSLYGQREQRNPKRNKKLASDGANDRTQV